MTPCSVWGPNMPDRGGADIPNSNVWWPWHEFF
ncbi:hypothetical protein GQ55_9G405700 [Panicum hallii var. hallii]|uniref:Uncharacterized protein n=1 Tax=Panicum hallii var. hallii TaxID=1504633 RepID=A0A2T7CA29_9POAL|nr:hypothetical protein GQ55_9G405700 [Panicum hallii var. hallii]